MTRSLKILFAVAEASPLVKVGGLADVAGSLPWVLRQQGHDVRIIMPHYPAVDKAIPELTHLLDGLAIPMMGQHRPVSVSVVASNGVPTYLVANDHYFQRARVYGEPDDLERFLFFSRALLRAVDRLDWQPDIIHCHDWHTAAAIAMLKTDPELRSLFSRCATVFTIHNLAYQGWFDDHFVSVAGIGSFLPRVEPHLRNQLYSMMALGIYYADVVSTVSPTYAREILTSQYGEKLETVLGLRREDLYGIVNGIDVEEFNPATDHRIPFNYDKDNPDRKYENKAALQRQFGLPEDPGIPVLGMVGRLATQKGIDILVSALPAFLQQHEAQFILLGTGEPNYVRMLAHIATGYQDKMSASFSFDAELAQFIYAGSDLFLMPSQFEPCGLGQLIAFRYGTIPVVRHTGGLVDTVEDVSPGLETGNGFVFQEYTAEALLKAMHRAVTVFKNRDAWRRLVVRAMSANHSWGTSAKEYEALYNRALEKVS
ncbi:MAG: glycogen synthase [Chloroflexi bacterium]|nr:glycogen synthase [Chloroflexota bacterium]